MYFGHSVTCAESSPARKLSSSGGELVIKSAGYLEKKLEGISAFSRGARQTQSERELAPI